MSCFPWCTSFNITLKFSHSHFIISPFSLFVIWKFQGSTNCDSRSRSLSDFWILRLKFNFEDFSCVRMVQKSVIKTKRTESEYYYEREPNPIDCSLKTLVTFRDRSEYRITIVAVCSKISTFYCIRNSFPDIGNRYLEKKKQKTFAFPNWFMSPEHGTFESQIRNAITILKRRPETSQVDHGEPHTPDS